MNHVTASGSQSASESPAVQCGDGPFPALPSVLGEKGGGAVSLRAYLLSMWTILWTALRYPAKTTEIDLMTGKVIRHYLAIFCAVFFAAEVDAGKRHKRNLSRGACAGASCQTHPGKFDAPASPFSSTPIAPGVTLQTIDVSRAPQYQGIKWNPPTPAVPAPTKRNGARAVK